MFIRPFSALFLLLSLLVLGTTATKPAASHAVSKRTEKVLKSQDGSDVYAVAVGNPKNPPIVFVHGLAMNIVVWDRLFANQELTKNFYLVSSVSVWPFLAKDKITIRSLMTCVDTGGLGNQGLLKGTNLYDMPKIMKPLRRNLTWLNQWLLDGEFTCDLIYSKVLTVLIGAWEVLLHASLHILRLTDVDLQRPLW